MKAVLIGGPHDGLELELPKQQKVFDVPDPLVSASTFEAPPPWDPPPPPEPRAVYRRAIWPPGNPRPGRFVFQGWT